MERIIIIIIISRNSALVREEVIREEAWRRIIGDEWWGINEEPITIYYMGMHFIDSLVQKSIIGDGWWDLCVESGGNIAIEFESVARKGVKMVYVNVMPSGSLQLRSIICFTFSSCIGSHPSKPQISTFSTTILLTHFIYIYQRCSSLALKLICLQRLLSDFMEETGQQNLVVLPKIGEDESYYECVDNGGDLVCCDICSNVYHLWCHNPPLEHVPSGEWRCSNCKESNPSVYADDKIEQDVKISKMGKAPIAPLNRDGVDEACVTRKEETCSELDHLKVYRRTRFKLQARKEEDVKKNKSEANERRNLLAEEVTGTFPNLSNMNTITSKLDCEDKPTGKDKGEITPLDLLADVCTNPLYKNIREMPAIKKAFDSNKKSAIMDKKSALRNTSRFPVQYLETKTKEHDKEDNWPFEDELNSLWIGVRKHGQSSWETILNDPTLKFSYFRTPTSLAKRWWRVERQKVQPEIIQVPRIYRKRSSSSDSSSLLSKKLSQDPDTGKDESEYESN
ncbi:tyrosine-protein kinase BAZ1B-like isoform X2 [Impatiens glandulifera]|uniref:tyrosine-protein kinase BAZ1B-like isoform X2 n=1 Tax=Impatiens glandulifera TaxID=253017 RepID=UPI001FB16D2A|nr:tyrosine-protein kinase BAZ1B-like isoform X2 [Impatiens glandulifera]